MWVHNLCKREPCNNNREKARRRKIGVYYAEFPARPWSGVTSREGRLWYVTHAQHGRATESYASQANRKGQVGSSKYSMKRKTVKEQRMNRTNGPTRGRRIFLRETPPKWKKYVTQQTWRLGHQATRNSYSWEIKNNNHDLYGCPSKQTARWQT